MELKKSYKIGELAKLLGISKSTLLYWEGKGYIPRPRRDNTLSRGRYWLESEAKEIYLYYQTNYTRF